MTQRSPASHMNSTQFSATMQQNRLRDFPNAQQSVHNTQEIEADEQPTTGAYNETILFEPQYPYQSGGSKYHHSPHYHAVALGQQAHEVSCPQCGCRFVPSDVTVPSTQTLSPKVSNEVREPIRPPKVVQKQSQRIGHPELAQAEYEAANRSDDAFAGSRFKDYAFANLKERNNPLPAPQFQEFYQEYTQYTDKAGYLRTIGTQFKFSATQFCSMARLLRDEEKRLQLAISMKDNIFYLQNNLDEVCRLFSTKTNVNRFRRSV